MRIRPIIAGALLASVLFCGHQARAFTLDEKSNTNADGSPRFVDPDEQLSPFLLFGAQGPNQPTSDDRNFGPRYTAPASNATDHSSDRWPTWLFSTPSPRK